jgi:hypothetical protein
LYLLFIFCLATGLWLFLSGLPLDESPIYNQENSCMYMRTTVGKHKSYELTKPQTILLRDRRHGSRIALIGLRRIGATGAVTGDDDDYD